MITGDVSGAYLHGLDLLTGLVPLEAGLDLVGGGGDIRVLEVDIHFLLGVSTLLSSHIFTGSVTQGEMEAVR